MRNRGLIRSKQQKTAFSRSVSQHGSGVVVGEAVGAAVVGEAVGEAVGAVGADVGLTVGQSVPRAVPVVVSYATPLLRGTTGPHSPALPTIFLHRRTSRQCGRSRNHSSARVGQLGNAPFASLRAHRVHVLC
jgi:hypothetical protein